MLLDGHSLAYRAFFALPTSLVTSTGQITNAVYGFTSMLIKLLTEQRTDRIGVAFDLGAPTIRLAQYAEYKAGRAATPAEFSSQLGLLREVLDTLRVPVFQVPDHEADDVIATLARRSVEKGLQTFVVTADRDMLQLVDDHVSVLFNRKGISDVTLYDTDAVVERFGIPPEKLPDLVALKGDPSDNLPGVPGVGDKTASALVQQFGSVEAMYERLERDPAEAPQARPQARRGEGAGAAEQAPRDARRRPRSRRGSRGDPDGGVGPRGRAEAVPVARVPLPPRAARRRSSRTAGCRIGVRRASGRSARI